MAKYNIEYRCGHSGKLDIGGPTKDRERIAKWHEGHSCPECREAEKIAARVEANKKASDAARNQGLPELAGSLKQIAYGETCRQEILDKLAVTHGNIISNISGGHVKEDKITQAKEAIALFERVIAYIKSAKTAAAWWIDNKAEVSDLYRRLDFVQRMDVEASRSAIAVPEPIKQTSDSIVRPEETKSETVVTIRIIGEIVEAHFSEKRDDFREIVKGLGFSWDSGRWARKIGKRSGTPVDRAAELGHLLLAGGFVVSSNDEVISKAIAADYDPEHTSWITTVKTDHDKYPGWFYILWGKDDDYYNAARRITGSKYLKPGIVVNPRYFDQVIDFASVHNFRFTESAEQAIDIAMAARDREILVDVPTLIKRERVVVRSIPDKLAIPDEVVIDESLRDDD
ncbi:hypothetical protein COLU111180_12715 [Cohnella lubricantis]|uniref:Uncharacterized protein n=1 Tax=Cohnella lubricantis TaxID=2163172 RepID=A0A841T917_9BACL|nr:hypothetical protein [Cohnella lubricantis]MBB6677432.1 hypothetical protein [Cohnella lubricantis]MBP2117520.1 hypothetical protein [Cohnella lubricantis]